MCAMRNTKRNSLPSLSMNKFFVNKRASMFERHEETPREKREWSPCGMVETSQRKLEARKEKEKKVEMRARLKRQADPYAEESSDDEVADEELTDQKACGHANRSVNFNLVKKEIKQGQAIGECTQCRKGHRAELNDEEPNDIVDSYEPVIWLCLFCGHQGCDRNTRQQHALLHYRTPRSNQHCLILNTQAWTVWCYECDSEIHQTSSKKLHELVEYIKRQRGMAPHRSNNSRPVINSTLPYSGPECGSVTIAKSSLSTFEDNSKAAKNQRNAQASVLASLPKVKGLSNLGNTCFFNSVVQCLAQTHFLTQLLDVQCQSGQHVYLPGRQQSSKIGLDANLSNGDIPQKRIIENGRVKEKTKTSVPENEDDDDIELKPLDLILPEGGGLTLALSKFLKDMHSIGKNPNPILNPGHLFGQICKKSTQFQGYEQQDAHELLRCLLNAITLEEIVRAKRAILRAFALSEKTDPNTVSPRLKMMIRGYGRQATHTIVDNIFGGQLISTVFCEECHWSSQVFEPFMDLSLPINEEKGKPKKVSPSDDESVFDCFGRSTGNSNTVSKHQLKKQKKEEKKNRRNKKGRAKGGSLAPDCMRANAEDDKNVTSDKKTVVESERLKIRLTEKSRPEDTEERIKLEEERKAIKEAEAAGKAKSESLKFKRLMAAKKTRSHQPSDEEESDEDSEYDDDDEEEEKATEGKDKNGNTEESVVDSKVEVVTSGEIIEKSDDTKEKENVQAGGNEGEGEKDSEEEEEEEDEEEEEEEEDESEESEDGTKANDSDNTSSKKKSSYTEISDADIEDNTDSDRVRQQKYHNTRQPSIIVVEQSESETRTSNSGIVGNHRRKPVNRARSSLLFRCLKNCYSSDQLNYNSASDTSERYFTPNERECNGLDTGDDLDNYHDPGVPVDQSHMDEICLKVGELKIRRKSNSKESLLDTQRTNRKCGSTETLHTFKERIGDGEGDELSKKKTKSMKKLKQEWIARSLTTLAPRYQCRSQECSIMSCLTNFTAPELLTGNNKIICENCTKIHNQHHPEDYQEAVKSNASKQLLILSPPAVLTLQLKRFHHVGFNLTKVNRHVRFPLVTDLAPFTSSISLGLGNMSRNQNQVLYGLYGVVEHSGRLNSGHYVAYVRSRPLDPTRTSKQYLNLKPSSQFEIDQLVAEMAEKIEASSGSLGNDLKSSPGNATAVSREEYEEEVKAGRWFHVSDTYVAEVNIERVLKAQAYLLFYERLV